MWEPGGKARSSPTNLIPNHYDNLAPPPGPLSNQECDHPSPHAFQLGLGRRGEKTPHPTPQARSLARRGEGACSKGWVHGRSWTGYLASVIS